MISLVFGGPPSQNKKSCAKDFWQMATPKLWSDVEVLDFLSARAFLEAVIESRRQRKKEFSIRQFSQRIGFKSPGTLSMILSGKRGLTHASAEKIAKGLALKGRRRKYFMLLAQLESTKSVSEKAELRKEIMDLQSMVNEKLLEPKKYRFLSQWYYAVIYVMIGQADFEPDPEAILKRLGKTIKKEEIERAIQDLLDLGLIRKNDEGRFQQCDAAIKTADDSSLSSALFSYYRQMIQLSQEALNLPFDEREFNGLTVELPKEEVPYVKEKIREFRSEMNQYLSKYSGNGEIYQLNLNLFPLTRTEK